MSTVIHLILGLPGAYRTERLIAAYAEAAREFGSALFLTPTRRHAENIREFLSAVLNPLIFDIQGFGDELVRIQEPDSQPHADVDRQLLLDSVLSEFSQKKVLPYFSSVSETRGYADAANGYIAELKEAGIDHRQLLKATPDLKRNDSPNRHVQATRIFQRYQSHLAKLHRLDPPDRLGVAGELWAKGKRLPFERVRYVFLSGFTYFSPVQRKLIGSIKESVEHLWLELPDGEGEAFAELQGVRNWISGSGRTRSLFDTQPEVKIEWIEPAKDRPDGLKRTVRLFGDLQSALTPPPPLPEGEGEKSGSLSPPERDSLGVRVVEAPGEL